MRKNLGLASALLFLVAACEPGAQSVVGAPPDAITGSDAGARLDAGSAPVVPAPVLDSSMPSAEDFAQPDAAPTPLADVEVVITTDNAFSFGYGNDQVVDTFMQGVPSGWGEIFNCPVDYGPEPFVVPAEKAPEDAYLYIIAWADRDWTQGALAQFRRAGSSSVLYSGDAEWEVCATGMEYDGTSNGPDQATVNQYVAECQKGASGTTFSKGWVDRDGPVTEGAVGKLAVGETNEVAAGEFPVVCQQDDAGVGGLDPAAQWMWFDPQDGASPFTGNLENRTKAFLIFRLPAASLEVF